MKILVTLLLFVVANNVFAQQWSYERPLAEGEVAFFGMGDVSGEYNYAVSIIFDTDGNKKSIIYSFDEDGLYKEKQIEDNIRLQLTVGLGDGNVIVVGLCFSDESPRVYKKLWVALLNPNLEILKESYYILDENLYLSYGTDMRGIINDDNELVFVTNVVKDNSNPNNVKYDFVFYKSDLQCNMLKEVYVQNPSGEGTIMDFTEVPNMNRYVLLCEGMAVTPGENMSYFDEDFNYISSTLLSSAQLYPVLLLSRYSCVDHWIDEEKFLLSSMTANNEEGWAPMIVEMDTTNYISNYLILRRPDTDDYISQYRSMAYCDSDNIYISAHHAYPDWIFSPKPNTAVVYKINDKLELLGVKKLDLGIYMHISFIQPTSDGSCIIHGNKVFDENNSSIYFCKISDEDMMLSIEESDYQSYYDAVVYPNPVSSMLNIDVSAESKIGDDARLIITDMLGRRCMEKDIAIDDNTLSIDVSLLNNGIYVYEIIVNDKSIVKDQFLKK